MGIQIYGNMMDRKLKFRTKITYIIRFEDESPNIVKPRSSHTKTVGRRDGLPACASRPPVFTIVQGNAKRSGKSADNTSSISIPFRVECIKNVESVPPRRPKSG